MVCLRNTGINTLHKGDDDNNDDDNNNNNNNNNNNCNTGFMICSPEQILLRMFKLRRTRWMEHAARMEQSRNANRNLLKIPEGKRPIEDLGLDGKILR